MDSAQKKLNVSKHCPKEVLRYWDELLVEEKDELLEQISNINWEEFASFKKKLFPIEAEIASVFDNLEPVKTVGCDNNDSLEKAIFTGKEALKKGRIAMLTVAGGQGTRLGIDGPKGILPITPIKQKSLFQVFAEKIRSAINRYGQPIYWFIMTSEQNHEQTVQFFQNNKIFDLEYIRFFKQRELPIMDHGGNILLEKKHKIAMSPDGHGGALYAMLQNGLLDLMDAKDIDIISSFQVDNPLVNCTDEAFIGFHLLQKSEMSSKIVPKAYPEEKVGVFVKKDGKTTVVEYSNMPEHVALKKNSDNGNLVYNAANIAIHLINKDFVRKEEDANLPFHLAKKKVKCLNNEGKLITQDCIKLEKFIFDALIMAQNPLVFETKRDKEFSPVKNLAGKDSVETCRNDLKNLFLYWLKSAGENISSENFNNLEISPLFADNERSFIEKWESLKDKPTLTVDFYYE